MTDSRPTVARRTLARFLRTRREEQGIRIPAAARDAGITPSTLSRIETGAVRVEVGTALLLMRNYGVPEPDRDVMEELAHAARQKGFWQKNRSGIPEWFFMYLNLESEASRIRTYEPDLIPGFLQTPDYSTALMNYGALPPKNETETIERVRVRGLRQNQIFDKEIPTFVVLSESAIHRIVGGRETMREQFQSIRSFQKEEHLDIRVLPFSQGDHPGNYGRFTLLDFPKPHDHSVVYTEYAGGSIYLEEENEITTYEKMFHRLTSMSLGSGESLQLISEVADKYI